MDRQALQAIKAELVRDGYIGVDGKITENGKKLAESAGISPSVDVLIMQSYKRSTSVRGHGGTLVGAVFPKTEKPKNGLINWLWKKIRRK